MKGDRKYIAFFAFVFVLLVVVAYLQPRPINWHATFSKKDKIPYGDFVLYDFLSDIFPGKNISTVKKPIYNTLTDSSAQQGNYIIINETFGVDSLDFKYLRDYVQKGNNVFIAADDFSGAFADSLKLSTNADFTINAGTKDSISLNFTNPSLQFHENFHYKKGTVDYYFIRYDTAHTTILGTNSQGKDNYIKISCGEGAFFISTVPFAFTNYNALKGKNSEYIFRALSYLPVADTRWDEYYKPFKEDATTPLRFILSNQSLKTAYYLMLFGLILYVIFEGKRRQRIIPVINPLQNTSLEFVETIGRLYYQKGTYLGIAHEKISFFFENIRSRYNIPTNVFDNAFYISLSGKTLIPQDELVKLFTFIQQVNTTQKINEETLLKLNTEIETFYRKTQ